MIERDGSRPEMSSDGPQRQLSDQSTPELWGRLVFETFSLPGVVEGRSAVSPASSRAVFLEIEDVSTPETSLAPDARLEPVHLHGVDDTSIHLCLPQQRAAEVCALGWAEPHQYGDSGTELLVYGPRSLNELEFVLALIRESLAFARANN